jgi:hypothetical protein
MTSNPTAPALFGNVTVRDTNSLSLADPKVSQSIAQMVQTNTLTKLDDQKVVLFGSERQKVASAALDGLLVEVTKGTSPVLFELFRQLNKGVDETDLGKLESEIRAAQNTKWWHGILDTLKLSSVAKRIEAANDKIGGLLQAKSANLLTLTSAMEKQIQDEVGKLITDGKRLDKLANEFRTNVTEFTIYVEAAKQILAEGEAELARRNAAAKLANDPLMIEDAKKFEQRVDLFRARGVVLETILAKAPVELESIRLTQGAALTVLSETANGAVSELSDIKSILLKLATAHQIASVQGINDQRRQLRDKLQSYGTQMLGNVALAAVKAQGQNRIEDATKLLDFATKVQQISKVISDEEKQNLTRYGEARTKLNEVKKLMGAEVIIDVAS